MTGQVWGCYQINPGADWSGWGGEIAVLSGGQNFDAGEIALAGQNDGMLMLIAQSGGELAALPQIQPGGSWGAWTALGLGGQTEPVKNICACQQGGTSRRPALGARRRRQGPDPVSGYAWRRVGCVAGLPRHPARVVRADRRGRPEQWLHVFFGVGEKGDLWSVGQTAPGGGWGKWKTMTPPPPS